MFFYPFWFGIRFGSPNHWFCRTTEPHRTSGSAELTEPNRTFGLTLLLVPLFMKIPKTFKNASFTVLHDLGYFFQRYLMILNDDENLKTQK